MANKRTEDSTTDQRLPLSRRLWDWSRPVLIILLIGMAFRSSIADWNDVPTGSMKPAIIEGDRIFVNKLAYGLCAPYTDWSLAEWSSPSRGDVVVFFNPRTQQRMVKRVIGLPGDTVEMKCNVVYINGKPADYRVLKQAEVHDADVLLGGRRIFAEETFDGSSHIVMRTPGLSSKRSFKPVSLGPEDYFLLGDNRDNSSDSRYFGPVHKSLIRGKAVQIIFSLDRANTFRPRANRFLHGLD
ncbi:MAG: signal peptidase I [Phycisphaerae bacterium]